MQRRRWHYYLLDFCYFANALMLAHLWLLPHSALLHKVPTLSHAAPLGRASRDAHSSAPPPQIHAGIVDASHVEVRCRKDLSAAEIRHILHSNLC